MRYFSQTVKITQTMARTIILMLIMSGLFTLSNLAAANVESRLMHTEMKAESSIITESGARSRVADQSSAGSEEIAGFEERDQRICSEACGDTMSISCVKHCEASSAIAIRFSPLLFVQKRIIVRFIYNKQTPDRPQLVELKPPQYHSF